MVANADDVIEFWLMDTVCKPINKMQVGILKSVQIIWLVKYLWHPIIPVQVLKVNFKIRYRNPDHDNAAAIYCWGTHELRWFLFPFPLRHIFLTSWKCCFYIVKYTYLYNSSVFFCNCYIGKTLYICLSSLVKNASLRFVYFWLKGNIVSILMDRSCKILNKFYFNNLWWNLDLRFPFVAIKKKYAWGIESKLANLSYDSEDGPNTKTKHETKVTKFGKACKNTGKMTKMTLRTSTPLWTTLTFWASPTTPMTLRSRGGMDQDFEIQNQHSDAKPNIAYQAQG